MSRLHTENEQSASYNRWLFTWAHSKTFTAREVFNGRLGDLPLLMVVSSGFSRTHCGPGVHHMQHFETGKVLFAFQRAFQRRVLLHDSRDRALSLPQLSPILFNVKDPLNGEEKVLTASEVVKTMTLPVRLSFHQKEDLVFIVDRDFKDHQFFGDLTLVSVYLEPFLCCLSVGNEDGKMTNKVVALPCRLRRARMSQVDGVTRQSDRRDSFNGLLQTYLEAARNVSPRQVPFCRELAFISRKTKIMMETDIPDYIGDDTFIDSTYRTPRQRQPGAEADCKLYEPLQPVDGASNCDWLIELDAQREDFAKHIPRRPEKHHVIFTWNESKLFTPREIYDGALGGLPLLLGMNLGFYRIEEGPGHKHLHHFESGLLLYAFQKAAQRRVLLHDCHGRTLSLPLNSSVAFRVQGKEAKGAMTLLDIVETVSLPVKINFDRKENLEFAVEGARTDHRYFGILTAVCLYEEHFIHCLPVGHQDGKPGSESVPLPCRLDKIDLSLVTGVAGQKNSREKLEKVYSDCQKAMQKLELRVDPFYKELVLISKTARITKEADIPNYIDENVFIDIRYKVAARGLDTQPMPAIVSKSSRLPYDSFEPTYSHNYAAIKLTSAASGGQESPRSEKPLPEAPLSWKATTTLSAGHSSALPPLHSRPKRESRPLQTTRSRALGISEESEYAEIVALGWSSGSSGSDRSEIDDLSIEDVLMRLRDLGLGKYCKQFKKMRIDGKLLRKLTRRALEDELKMSEIDIVKLTMFISEGHIPR